MTTRMPKLFLYLHTPVPIFKARVNMQGTIPYPISTLHYDVVTLGAYTDVYADQTLLLGTTEGADDLGRVRVKRPAADGEIYIARSSQGIEDGTLWITDDAYITVLDDYRVWAKLPYFQLDDEGDIFSGIDYKDGDEPVGDNMTDIPPVANCGPGTAAYVDVGTGLHSVTFPPASTDISYAMADGATITNYLWDVGDGTVTGGTITAAALSVDFPAGFRWVALTVTDSNGKQHTARCPVLSIAAEDDPVINHYHLTQQLEVKGSTLSIELQQDALRTDYPDGTLVMYWWDSAIEAGDRSHMKFIGWLDTESATVGRRKEGVRRSTKLTASDVGGRLAKLPGFPQALERVESDSLWSWMTTLDMHKALHYLLYWHSTALQVADFIMPSGLKDYNSMRIDSGASSLFDQVDALTQKLVPDHYLTVTPQSQLVVKEDWMLVDLADRPAITPTLTEEDWNSLSYDYNRHPKVHVLRSGAILVHTAFVDDGAGNDTVPTVFSIAPGNYAAFGQGLSESSENEGLALSQGDLNVSEGHRYALLNSRWGDWSFEDPTGVDFWDYVPALYKRVQLNIGASYEHYRGLPFTELVGRIKSISVNATANKHGLKLAVNAVMTREEVGAPAITYIPDSVGIPEEYILPPPFNPGLDSGQEVLAGIGQRSVYRTSDFQTPDSGGGPTWTSHSLGISEDLLSWVVDPFSPGYIEGSGAVNGWGVSNTAIYRITDLFGTVGCTSIHTFAVALGTSSVPAQEWRTIQCSFGEFFSENNPWIMVVSHYRNASGHTGTWALSSQDGGATWSSEVEITAHYDADTTTHNRPIGLYMSPKTPGYALTLAYSITTSPAPALGYVTTNWGATWTVVSEMDSGIALGGDVHVPWLAEGDSMVYHGKLNQGGGTAIELMPVMAHFTEDDLVIILGPSATGSLYITTHDTTPSAPSPWDEKRTTLFIAPPPTTKRMNVTLDWFSSRDKTGASSTVSMSLVSTKHILITQTGNDTHTTPAFGGSNNGSDAISYVFTGGDWPTNNVSIYVTPPTSTGQTGAYFTSHVIASCFGSGNFATGTLNIEATVTEIELDNGTIYTPVNGADFAFSLQRVNADSSVDDVSPAANTGLNHYGFGIRTYDNDLSFASVGARDDTHCGVWVSEDGGGTWTAIVSGVVVADVLYGLSAAFSGTDPDVLFLWGGYDDSGHAIAYTNDFGTTVDDRSGNLASLGTFAFIGIAGGPTP